MILIGSVLLIILIVYAKCDQEGELDSKKSLVQFRRKVEELFEETTVDTKTDDPHGKLVSFLVENLKEIFNDVYDLPATVETVEEHFHEPTLIFRTTTGRGTIKELKLSSISQIVLITHTDDVMLYENLSLTPLPFLIDAKVKSVQLPEDLTGKVEKSKDNLTTDWMILGRQMQDKKPNNQKKSANVEDKLNVTTSENISENTDQRRSCIFCNNVENEVCNDPESKLIPSILCKNENDLCYSQHTPFGIVVRGCYEVHQNMSVYVCSCNLCNHLTMSEMPFIFTKKQDWVENVIELSHTRHFKKSIFKDMSCLSCTVNASKKGDMLNEVNCLEGNIGSLPSEVCEKNEICGIKSIRSKGYLWRGCVKKPLYNYWLTLCDSDLCNHDPVTSVFDSKS